MELSVNMRKRDIIQCVLCAGMITAAIFLHMSTVRLRKTTKEIIVRYEDLLLNKDSWEDASINPPPMGTVATYFQSLDEDRTEYTFYNKAGHILEIRITELSDAQKRWQSDMNLSLKRDYPLPEGLEVGKVKITKVNEKGDKVPAFSGWIGELEWIEKIQTILSDK